MKAKEELNNLRSLDIKKLDTELNDAERKLIESSLKVKAGKMDNYSIIDKTKKRIARINSIKFEKNLEQ